MLEHLTGAMFFASWTSIIWAPLVMGVAVWNPRWRWIAAIGIAIALFSLFASLSIYHSFRPDCESLQQHEVLCGERNIARAILLSTMFWASLIASVILLVGWLISRKLETRKAAH